LKEATKQKEVQEGGIMPSNQLECIFDALPDSVFACDCEGKILRINAAALKLFEVASEALCRGTLYQQFLHHYEMGEEQQRALSLEPWLMSLIIGGEAASNPQEETNVLQVPSGQKVYVNICSIPMLDEQKQAAGTVYAFYDITHRYQKARHV
jgi:PAS domain-containing protein